MSHKTEHRYPERREDNAWLVVLLVTGGAIAVAFASVYVYAFYFKAWE